MKCSAALSLSTPSSKPKVAKASLQLPSLLVLTHLFGALIKDISAIHEPKVANMPSQLIVNTWVNNSITSLKDLPIKSFTCQPLYQILSNSLKKSFGHL
jgi:hypothetical protein